MGAMSRTKGQSGEREVAALIRDLTGWDVQRRARQHDGDSDLMGAPGWTIEVKRHASASRADLRGWWAQAVAQCSKTPGTPVLFYRRDRDEWRAVWPMRLGGPAWAGYEWTQEASVEAWAAHAREVLPC